MQWSRVIHRDGPRLAHPPGEPPPYTLSASGFIGSVGRQTMRDLLLHEGFRSRLGSGVGSVANNLDSRLTRVLQPANRTQHCWRMTGCSARYTGTVLDESASRRRFRATAWRYSEVSRLPSPPVLTPTIAVKPNQSVPQSAQTMQSNASRVTRPSTSERWADTEAWRGRSTKQVRWLDPPPPGLGPTMRSSGREACRISVPVPIRRLATYSSGAATCTGGR
jgi:hypothetical protein